MFQVLLRFFMDCLTPHNNLARIVIPILQRSKLSNRVEIFPRSYKYHTMEMGLCNLGNTINVKGSKTQFPPL